MPAIGSQFTVGKDLSLVITLPSGQLTLHGLINFSAKPITAELESLGIDGYPRFGVIPKGYNLMFRVDRLSANLDKWWAAQEAGYFAGNTQKAGTIYETITEANGTVSQWRYTGVVLKLEDSGDFAGDKKVEQSLSGKAAKKIQVS